MGDNSYLKGILRKEYLKKRKDLDDKFINQASTKINHKIMNHDIFKQAECILIYVPFNKEVNVIPLIEYSWAIGKGVLLPKTNTITKEMNPYLINSWDETEIGNYKIVEPNIIGRTPFPLDKIDLVIMPGVIFDKKGNRLGYGGGYYDRFFNRIPIPPYRIAVAFEMQLIDSLPTSPHDVAMNEVVTEKCHILLG